MAERTSRFTARLDSTWALGVAAILVWAGVVVAARVVGLRVIAHDPRAALFAPPLAARWDPRFVPSVVLPLALGATAVLFGPMVAGRLRWRWLLLAGFAAAAAWAVALAQIDGIEGLTGDANYLHDVPLVGNPVTFLSHFVAHIGRYTQHVRAHPPGMVVLLSLLDRIGLGGRGWEAVLVVVGGSAMVPAALLAVREVAEEGAARAAAPFLVFAPVAIWVATSADALFMGVTSWAAALLVLATGRADRRGDLMSLAGGLLFGAALFLSYGVLLVALVPVAAGAWRRRWKPLVLGAAGTLFVAAAFWAGGFWWPSGLHATLQQYRDSAAQFRPQSSFWLIDLGAFALALGPAVVMGLVRLGRSRLWLLVGPALIAVAMADATGFSKGEVERIWLPFAPWLLVSCAALARTPDRPADGPAAGTSGDPHRWSAGLPLALQVLVALALQVTIRSP